MHGSGSAAANCWRRTRKSSRAGRPCALSLAGRFARYTGITQLQTRCGKQFAQPWQRFFQGATGIGVLRAEDDIGLVVLHANLDFEWTQMLGRQTQRARLIALCSHHRQTGTQLFGPLAAAHGRLKCGCRPLF